MFQIMIRSITNGCNKVWSVTLQTDVTKYDLLHYKLVCQSMIRSITNGCNKVWSVTLQTDVTKYDPLHYKHYFGLYGIRSCDQPVFNLHRHPKTASYLLNKRLKLTAAKSQTRSKCAASCFITKLFRIQCCQVSQRPRMRWYIILFSWPCNL